jgi:hypothetical protein
MRVPTGFKVAPDDRLPTNLSSPIFQQRDGRAVSQYARVGTNQGPCIELLGRDNAQQVRQINQIGCHGWDDRRPCSALPKCYVQVGLMALLDVLAAKPNGNDLANRIVSNIRPEAEKLLKHATDLFPQFTDHSVAHSDRVVQLLGYLIPDEVIEKLNALEIYFLLAATYYHDLGMILECPGVPAGVDWDAYLASQVPKGQAVDPEVERLAAASFVRDRHHIRSEEFIVANRTDLELRASDTLEEARIVARIARGHRKDDLGDPDLYGSTAFGVGEVVRVDLLAAYLRLADELDVTALRTPLAEYGIVPLTDTRSQEEWTKHLSIHGVDFDKADPSVIWIHATCEDPETYPLLTRLGKQIDRKLQEIRAAIPRTYGTRDGAVLTNPIPYREVRLDVKTPGFFPIEIQFELEREKILDLLLGERFYGAKEAAIRELLQNAVDTCHEAKLVRGAEWQPNIRIEYDQENGVLEISDNGMGMDIDIVRDYFGRIGISYYTSPAFRGGFRPISEFGIGFLSSFMIADAIELESKRDGSEPILLQIQSPNEPFVPRKGNVDTVGTRVRLKLKDEVREIAGDEESPSALDPIQAASHYARYVDVPIVAVDAGGIERIVSRNDLMPTPEEIEEGVVGLRMTAHFKEAELRPFLASKDISDYYHFGEAGGIRMGVILLDELLDGWDYRAHPLGWASNMEVQTRIYQGGIYVSPMRAALMDNQLTWTVIDITGDRRFALTANRFAFAGDDLDLWNQIFELYSTVIERIFDERLAKGENPNWWNFHMRYYTGDSEKIPEALEASALAGATYCTVGNAGFEQMSLSEVRQRADYMYWTHDFSHETFNYLRPHMTDEDRIVFLPRTTYGIWKFGLTGISGERDLERFFLDRGIQFEEVSVFGIPMTVADLGLPDQIWGVPMAWEHSEMGGVPAIFDSQHPMTQALRQIGDQDVPRAIEHLAIQLFETTQPVEEFVGVVEEFVGALSNSSLIDDDVAESVLAALVAEEHICSLSFDRDFALKI